MRHNDAISHIWSDIFIGIQWERSDHANNNTAENVGVHLFVMSFVICALLFLAFQSHHIRPILLVLFFKYEDIFLSQWGNTSFASISFNLRKIASA